MRLHLSLAPLALIAVGAAPAPPERSFMLTDFDRVRIDGPFSVAVVTGAPARASVSGDARAMDRVNLRVDGGTLVIAPSTQGWDGWREGREGALVIRVGTRQLRVARVNGGGKLSIDRVAAPRVDLGVSGSGQLTIGTVDADQLVATLTGTGAITLSGGRGRVARFMTQGAGTINAAGANFSDLTVHSQSSGDSRFSATMTATVAALGSGAVRVAGTAKCRLSGPGPMTCAGQVEQRR